jgi:23S rRNA (uracil1939-C5)-methyltransferase
VGTFALFLMHLFPAIDLVEENKQALALARVNAQSQSSRCSAQFFAQRSEHWAAKNLCGQYGFIVADPPRQGFNQSLTLRLASDGPPVLAYVSCDPATLAKDSAILLDGGYTLTELRLYDFYPQTSHIESLALFEK